MGEWAERKYRQAKADYDFLSSLPLPRSFVMVPPPTLEDWEGMERVCEPIDSLFESLILDAIYEDHKDE